MSRSTDSSGAVAIRKSWSGSVIVAMRRAWSTQASMPETARSLVCAKPMRCPSSTRTPSPRSPRAVTTSIAPSFVSTDPERASRTSTSAVATRPERSVSSVRSTTSSFESRTVTGLRSLDSSTDDDGRDTEGRLRIGDGRALAVLAARPGGVAEIPADHVDLAHELRPLPDERRAPQRFGELPVTNAVALCDLEGEVAADDVDLPAAHLLDENAVLDRAHDRGGVGIAGGDHGVRHPADRQMPEALTARVAAARDAELLGVLAVGQVGPEDPLLDEHGALRRRRLVVHRRRATLTGIASVVDDRDELPRDLPADAARIHREALEVQVRLESVADRFVDQRPTGLARQDDGVGAGWCRLGANVEHRPPRCALRGVTNGVLGEHLEAPRAADRLET